MQKAVEILSYAFEELQKFCEDLSLKRFRASQIFTWLHKKRVSDFSDMNNIPSEIKNLLSEKSFITEFKVLKRQISKKDGTLKYLFLLNDGNTIESAVLKYRYGYTLCLSTQIGCRMNCDFCITGKDKFIRNLTAAEMAVQVYQIEKEEDIEIKRIVLMGMGEPLDNYVNVIKFFKIISNDKGKNLGLRNITLSSCGLVPEINKLVEEKMPINLVISLHATSDEIRDELMPINKKYNINSLLKVAKNYQIKTGRRVSFEYSLIDGLNDSKESAVVLSSMLKNTGFHLNLIQINEDKNIPYKKINKETLAQFTEILEKNGINFTVRRTLGEDIDAACGMLRQKSTGELH